MKIIVIKLLSSIILLVHLVSPAQAVVASMADFSDASASNSHCMQNMKHQAEPQEHDGTNCCQHDKGCNEANCSHCQASYATMMMLVSLHRQITTPRLSALSLVYLAEYLQGIPAQNLYRPPITIL